MKKIMFIIFGVLLLSGAVFAAKALSTATRELYINRMIRIHKYAVEIVEILSVPDTVVFEIIDKDIKMPAPDSLIAKRNRAAKNRFIKLKAVVDSMAEELNVP